MAGGLISLLTSALTLAGTYRLERLRWKQADERRLQQDRIRAYTRFLALVYELLTVSGKRPVEAQLALLGKYMQSLAEVDLLSSIPVREAAGELYTITVEDHNLADEVPQEKGKRLEKRDRWIRAYREAVRAELDLELPPPRPIGPSDT